MKPPRQPLCLAENGEGGLWITHNSGVLKLAKKLESVKFLKAPKSHDLRQCVWVLLQAFSANSL